MILCCSRTTQGFHQKPLKCYWTKFLPTLKRNTLTTGKTSLMVIISFNIHVSCQLPRGICFIVPGEKLALTLRFLATGETLQSLSYQFRIGLSTACYIVKEVCAAIDLVLSPDYLRQPTKEDWEQIAKHFDHLWDFPNCIGALDGKHIRMRCPANGGSKYINYKGIVFIYYRFHEKK